MTSEIENETLNEMMHVQCQESKGIRLEYEAYRIQPAWNFSISRF